MATAIVTVTASMAGIEITTSPVHLQTDMMATRRETAIVIVIVTVIGIGIEIERKTVLQQTGITARLQETVIVIGTAIGIGTTAATQGDEAGRETGAVIVTGRGTATEIVIGIARGIETETENGIGIGMGIETVVATATAASLHAETATVTGTAIGTGTALGATEAAVGGAAEVVVRSRAARWRNGLKASSRIRINSRRHWWHCKRC